MKSPAFSSMRSLFDLWDESAESMKIKALVEGNGLILFFKKDGEIFGAPESSRVTYARIKSGEDKEWAEQASFIAFNLNKALEGKKVQSMFSKKDLQEIEILDQEKAEKLLSKKGGKEEIPDLSDDEDGRPAAPDAPDNIEPIDEK